MSTERFDTYTEEPDVSLLILNFFERMNARNEGGQLKSEEKISIDSAIWYIDATLNFSYANANHPFARLHWDIVFAEHDCFGNEQLSGPKMFEVLLYQHYNPDPGNNCRWYFYGTKHSLILDYKEHQLNTTLVNYLDYKIFAASEAVAPFDDWTECLEYNYNNSGIHEMQFYFDHKKELINAWVSSAQNTGNKRFASSMIKSVDKNFGVFRYIWHKPTIYFRKRDVACTKPTTLPE